MGNHEGMHIRFYDEKTPTKYIRVDRFPFDSLSAEALFADEFVNPLTSLVSEDGSKYDPSPKTTDFPSYKENAYSFIYGNSATIVMNSDYWFAPDLKSNPILSGNPHAYIMDNQLKWFESEVMKFEKDPKIKHIFISVHTPFFPNGGHSGDDMWYSGNNKTRPRITGLDVEFGIIERRDQLLDIMVNKSKKVRTVLTGDEHNYNHLLINPEMEIYPQNWDRKRLQLNRSIYQINNGAAGAPYYAQEKLPWSHYCKSFTTRNALVFISVEGNKVSVETINPDTLEEIESFDIEQ
jgi:3',5'-cyclic AMP phosphodiesterase CpdA